MYYDLVTNMNLFFIDSVLEWNDVMFKEFYEKAMYNANRLLYLLNVLDDAVDYDR